MHSKMYTVYMPCVTDHSRSQISKLGCDNAAIKLQRIQNGYTQFLGQGALGQEVIGPQVLGQKALGQEVLGQVVTRAQSSGQRTLAQVTWLR